MNKKISMTILVLFLILFATIHIISAGSLSQQFEFQLGDRSFEIAEIIQQEMKEEVFLVVYEASGLQNSESVQVSTIMFFVEQKEDIMFYNLPLRTLISTKEAESLAAEISGQSEVDFIRINLHFFVDIFDLYDEIAVETAQGTKYMDSESAEDYLSYGLNTGGEYEYDRQTRQQRLMEALVTEMEEEGRPGVFELIPIFLSGLRSIETNLGFPERVNLALQFVSYGLNNIEIYQPRPDEYDL